MQARFRRRSDLKDLRHLVFDRPRSSGDDCPAQPRLDLMRERTAWLDETITTPGATGPTPAHG